MHFLGILNMDDLAMYLFDLTQNAIAAKGKKITCEIIETTHLDITLSDDGIGMHHDVLQKVTSPFFTTRTTRRVGLGLSLIRMLAEQTEGTLDVTSTPGQGTTLHIKLNHQHIDMPPIGHLGEMIVLISQNKTIDQYIFTYKKEAKQWTYDLMTYRQLLKDTLYDISVMQYLQEYLQQEINKVRENR